MLSRMQLAMMAAMITSQYKARFKEGQRVFVTTDSDMGGEQPEGVVVFPGSITTVLMDPEFRWPEEDNGLREIREDCLELVKI